MTGNELYERLSALAKSLRRPLLARDRLESVVAALHAPAANDSPFIASWLELIHGLIERTLPAVVVESRRNEPLAQERQLAALLYLIERVTWQLELVTTGSVGKVEISGEIVTDTLGVAGGELELVALLDRRGKDYTAAATATWHFDRDRDVATAVLHERSLAIDGLPTMASGGVVVPLPQGARESPVPPRRSDGGSAVARFTVPAER